MATLEQELAEAIKKLRALGKEFPEKQRKKILRKAAKPLIAAARNNIPDSDEPHFRYDTPKLNGRLRAPKGQGRIVAVYYPGNLRKSIKTKTFRRSQDIFVGPKTARRSTSGKFGLGSRVDGYYAHWMEFGTEHYGGVGYMRRAVSSTKDQVSQIIINEVAKVLNDFVQKNGV